jgi:hypothetical protein
MSVRSSNAASRLPGAFGCRVIALIFGVFAAFSSAPAAQAGFLEDLFGWGQSEQPRAAVARAPRDPRVRHAGQRRRAPARRMVVVHHNVADGSVAGSKPVRPELCYTGASATGAPSTEKLLHDATLRPGDTLVTDEGVRIFSGRVACPHTAGDFLTLAEARRIPKAQQVTLAAIEKTMKLHRSYTPGDAVVATDRDEPEKKK